MVLQKSISVLLAWALCAWPASTGYVPPAKYLIVSNAVNGTIGYAKLSAPGKADAMIPLITSGLVHPQGIAVDQKRQLLLVADSEPKKVFSYGLTIAPDGSLKVDEQSPVLENVEARWVAVDGKGNVFASDETQNQLMKVTAQQVMDGDTTAKVVYSGGGSVSAPGGLAVDNFYIYWSNKLNAEKAGSVVRNLQLPKNDTTGKSFLEDTEKANVSSFLQVLATNSAKTYAVCTALDNIFYTDSEKTVYAVKKSGGSVATITDSLTSPRGCVWDGDSTMYVADRSQGAVFSFDGPFLDLAQVDTKVNKVADYADAFGVAVFSGACVGSGHALIGALLLAVAASFAEM